MMKQRVLLLHGWGGSDYPHWQSWLAGELAKNYGTVSFPLIEHPHFPSKNRWVAQFKTFIETFNPDVVICHSLANITWFHLLHEFPKIHVKRLLLVAPPSLQLDIDTLKTFYPITPPPTLGANEVLMVASDNDPYMRIEEVTALATALNVETKIVPDGGHLNADSNYGPWPWVLEWVLQGEPSSATDS